MVAGHAHKCSMCAQETSSKQSSACKRLVSVRAELPRSALLRSSSAAKQRQGLYVCSVTSSMQSALGVTSVSQAELGWNAQVGFGSGFKCNSVVWKAIRNIHDTEHAEWAHMRNPANTDRCWNYIQVRCSLSLVSQQGLQISRLPATVRLARLPCGRRRVQQGSNRCATLMEMCLGAPIRESNA